MTEETSSPPRLGTGIVGLDRVIGGGLFRSSVYIVEGPPGAGKTILGNQMCHHHAAKGEQVVYLTLLAESHTRMIGHLRGLSFFRVDLVGKLVHYVSGFKVLESEGTAGLLRMIRETATPRKTTLLVIDGLVSAVHAADANQEYKRFIHELQGLAALTGCTVVVLVCRDGNRGTRAEDTIVDGVIELTDEVSMLRPLRHLQIKKLRGTASVRGKHTLEINEHGISVLPRIEAQLLRLSEQAQLPPGTSRVPFGIDGLDEMLHGGLPAWSTSMLLGPTGSGKTLFGLQFLAAGAARGESGLFFGFYERPYTLIEKSRRIGLGLDGASRQGLTRFAWEPFGEASIDVIGQRLLSLIEEQRPRRLVIDGMQGFQQVVDVPDRLRAVLSAIVDALEAQHITTIYTVESAELLDPLSRAPIKGISAVTHNLLALRHLEVNQTISKMIGVIKLRDSGFDPAMREYRLTDTGIDVARAQSPVSVRGGPPRSQRPPASPTEWGSAAERKPSILIVDDEFGLAELLAEVLAEQGYTTAIAINGELGLSMLRERKPDLLLLDLMMPVMDGPEMLRQMLADPQLSGIPVVVMTALPEAVPDEMSGKYADLLQKPFMPERLFEVVRAGLRRSSRQN
jgi:circadian clock protein KaiC